MSSADNLCKSGLIWIQTVGHSGGFPEIIFLKVNFETNQQGQKFMKTCNFKYKYKISTVSKTGLNTFIRGSMKKS